MKSLTTQILYFLRQRPSQISLVTFLRFLMVQAVIVLLYSAIFHVLMEREGRGSEYSWITGVYWTLTVMTTLGFGDITFTSDAGRLFSIIVMLSGIVLLLILFPFTFIEFFYTPWMKAQAEARTPRSLPKNAHNHVILTHFDPVTVALIRRLRRRNWPYALLVSDISTATDLFDQGYRVVIGDLDAPETYERVRADRAALVAATADDRVNTNVAATVREVASRVPIIATADTAASVDVLQLAGCSDVIQIAETMGVALAHRTLGSGDLVQILGMVEGVHIAEAVVTGTTLIGKRLADSTLRESFGLTVLGGWHQGIFTPAHPDMLLDEGMILILAGTEEQVLAFNRVADEVPDPSHPVLIIGGGRVGRATAKALAARGLDYRIIERLPERQRDSTHYVQGDAANIEVLSEAGIATTPAILVTTHDDDMNIYLTIYCRRLRPDAQIISRAVHERNVATMHRGGANFVMSYASLGATAILNRLDKNSVLVFAEGLDIFTVTIPSALAGKSPAATDIRNRTGCTVVAVVHQDDSVEVNPPPHMPLPHAGDLLLIGTPEAAERFQKQFKG